MPSKAKSALIIPPFKGGARTPPRPNLSRSSSEPTLTPKPRPFTNTAPQKSRPITNTATPQPSPISNRGDSASRFPDSLSQHRTSPMLSLPPQLNQSNQVQEQVEPTYLSETAPIRQRNNSCCSCCRVKPRTSTRVETQPLVAEGGNNTMYPETQTKINSDPAAISMEKARVFTTTSKDGSATYNIVIHHTNTDSKNPIRNQGQSTHDIDI